MFSHLHVGQTIGGSRTKGVLLRGPYYSHTSGAFGSFSVEKLALKACEADAPCEVFEFRGQMASRGILRVRTNGASMLRRYCNNLMGAYRLVAQQSG